jgi:hypothetical protein
LVWPRPRDSKPRPELLAPVAGQQIQRPLA